jgi:FlaA1/EpsC-like NDP-sugar epimerase
MYEELMTTDESEHAFDLNDMYAVLPTSFTNKHYEYYYKNYPKASNMSYNSHNVEVLSKNSVKDLLIQDGLI